MFYIRFFILTNERFAHIPSFLMSNVSESLRSLTKKVWCERISQVAYQKWVTISNSLTKNEWINESLIILSQALMLDAKGGNGLIPTRASLNDTK